MKTTLWFASLLLLAVACAPKQDKQTYELKPLTDKEVQAVQLSLKTGLSLEEALSFDSACNEFQDSLPLDYFKGTVQVPEDYSQPEGRKIRVFYYGHLTEGKDPIVFYNGGPAADSHSSYSVLQRISESKELSFIYIDQRGTGCSDPFPSEPTTETVERLTHYTSTEIVKDSEIIREKILGPKSQWKVFGQSYGGLIVHRYSLVAPQSIKGAYAHGFSLMEDQTEWLKMRILSQKRVLSVYFEKYPEDRALLAQARSQVSEDMCFEEDGTEVCGPKVLDALTMFLGFSTSWSGMHQTIRSFVDEDGDLMETNLLHFVRMYVFGVYNNNGLAGSVISMTEISGGGSDSETCKIVNDRLTAEGEAPEDWLINECRLLAGMKNDKWTEVLKGVEFKFGMTPADLKASLEKHPNLPFFLYSGEKDVFVPMETFEEEVKALGSRITYRQFPRSGHEGFYTERQVWTDILSVP